jgi:ribosomal-protein-serine acetyltransferase
MTIRWWVPDDAAAMLAAINADRNAMKPWLDWADTDNRTLAECHYNIERYRRAREKGDSLDFAFGIFDRTTGDPLGGTSFHRIDADTHQAEVGYWIRGDRQRTGLATEATAAMLTWGFQVWGFRRIEIRCAPENIASRRVPEKLGLRREMLLKQHRWTEGIGYTDTLGFAILANEWDPAPR